jgi:carboxyl-terminal processing protease
VQSLLDANPRPLRLVHADWLSDAGSDFRWSRRFGQVAVVEAVREGHANILDEISAKRKRILAWQASYRTAGIPEADFTGLLDWARDTLVEPGQEEHYTAVAINGYLTIGDAHAQIIPALAPEDAAAPRAAGNVRDDQAYRYTGIGASLSALAGNIIILGIVPDSPASAAGIEASDVLLAVDGQPVAGKSVPQVVALLRGAAGTEVALRIKRQDRVYDTRIRRATVQLRNVTSSVLVERGRSWGYLRIGGFNSERTCADTRRELRALMNADVDGIVLDLRDNMGGLIHQAACVADLFLDSRLLVLEIRSTRHRGRTTPLYTRHRAMTHVPMVTLVNAATGSASEALAAALQDHGRSPIIGQRTFGKGTIQTLRPWNDSGTVMMFYTAARMYTPSGRTAQLVGIEPDLWVTAEGDDPGSKRTNLREEDLFPTTLPSPVVQPERRRNWDLAGLEACLESDGRAQRRGLQWQTAESAGDYPRDLGVDLLHCLDAGGNSAPIGIRLADHR